MQKITLLFAATACIMLAACNQSGSNSDTQHPSNDTPRSAMRTAGTADSAKAYISIDTANKMLGSYLNSINASSEDSELRSVIIDADALRSFLNSPEGQDVSQMKIMFAHTLDYINKGGKDRRCGYRSGALTLILAGYNDAGNYIYYHNGVEDNGMPCPSFCPVVGTAKDDLLPH